MKKRAAYFVLCIFVAIFVITFLYHNDDKATKTISHYIKTTSAWQGPPTSNSNYSNVVKCVTGTPCTYPDVVDLRVIVITYQRPVSLLKCLRSLNTLVVDGNRAALEIWIDRDRKKGVDQRTLEEASVFKWTVGPTRVHVQVTVHLQVRWRTGGLGGSGGPATSPQPPTGRPTRFAQIRRFFGWWGWGRNGHCSSTYHACRDVGI